MEPIRMSADKQMRNMERLTVALRRRGFFITYLENRLILHAGSGKWELLLLQRLFDALQIKAAFNKDSVIMDDEFYFTEAMAEQVSFFGAYNQESQCPQHMRSWKTFVKRRHGYKLDTLTLDAGVAYLVKMLSKTGILTEMSCDGHGKQAPTIWFAGAWNAVWFEIVCGKLMAEERLHYRWTVEEDRRGSHLLTAKKAPMEKWNLELVQKDALQIGAYLELYAEELVVSKRQYFKHRSMKEQAMLLSQDYEALKSWMKEKVNVFC
ncbi:hypothetical protein GC093_24255 [Paenibacillus sp. LMG 31456]|uniref:Uncharacterized protein n=1 Tax=Paenibacillus foliorum TaxID=2654974 RepID=A0A972GT05_9BACL|nr:hypothetical protein [Paenibacillus foliorum]NOU96311.1 hypothetical protein [Paenibacillus foliorum]